MNHRYFPQARRFRRVVIGAALGLAIGWLGGRWMASAWSPLAARRPASTFVTSPPGPGVATAQTSEPAALPGDAPALLEEIDAVLRILSESSIHLDMAKRVHTVDQLCDLMRRLPRERWATALDRMIDAVDELVARNAGAAEFGDYTRALGILLTRWGRVDPKNLADGLFDLGISRFKNHWELRFVGYNVLKPALQSWAERDAAAAMDWLESRVLPFTTLDSVLHHEIAPTTQLILTQWMKHDPQEALAWALNQPQGKEESRGGRQGIFASLFATWVKTDRDAALAWAREQFAQVEGGVQTSEFPSEAKMVWQGLTQTDPIAALQFRLAQANGQTVDAVYMDPLYDLFSQWVRSDREHFVAIIKALPDDAFTPTLMLPLFTVARQDAGRFPETLELITSRLSPAESDAFLLRQTTYLIPNYQTSPEEVVTFLRQRPGRRAILQTLIDRLSDPSPVAGLLPLLERSTAE